ncbi:hypothetical protein CQW49_10370 [Methylosinus trichosporium OB3b]|uniref:Uncharacterized protein n=1 Tax=Methylosinus trichosporium (strain ATCC 35070 / NCIMB 11131 / UNIQEM 75 / OB3b) TaxID=595536 RepID=A0A2D2CZQ0_METT3|nr:hypothetical protein CQW49_10370 [Methylosinus trichosporium OB3b]OBS50593.1 hypothetical protein A8B73_20740 [Methylosinus sp. 3S-1]
MIQLIAEAERASLMARCPTCATLDCEPPGSLFGHIGSGDQIIRDFLRHPIRRPVASRGVFG